MTTTQTSYTVLVVDDEPLIRIVAIETLEDAGYQVLEASNSQEALEVLRIHGENIHVIMTDAHMPGEKNGIALVQQAKREYPKIRSIIVSGKAFQQQLPPGTIFIPKSYSYKALVDAVYGLCL
jgi:CheY-like chemotaxis protein